MKNTLHLPVWSALESLVIATVLFFITHSARAQGTTTWSGANTAVDINWSDAANWTTSGGSTPPGPTDSVIFGNNAFPASTNAVGATNNIVTASTSIGALSYLNVSPNTHTTQINGGQTLTVNGTFTAGVASSTTVATMTGTGNFTVNNVSGNFNVGGAGSSTETVTLALADGTNTINAKTLSVGESASNNGRQCNLNLGAGPTIINADSVNFGTGKASGTLQWVNAEDTNSLSIHDHTGTGRAALLLGNGTSGSGASNGKILAAGHPVTILASTITLGRLGNTTGNQQGTLTFDTGTVDATSVLMEVLPSSGVGAGTANSSQLNVGGNPTNSATLTVNSAGGGSFMISDSSNTSAGRVSSATFNLMTNGTALVFCPIAKAMAANNTATLNVTGGTLNMEAATNTIGTRQVPIDNVTLDFATLDFAEDGSSLNLAAGALTLLDTNIVNISSLPPIIHLPTSIPIITYTSLGGILNIGVNSLPGGYQGNIVDDGQGTISLVITSGPVVVAKQDEWLGLVNTNWDVTTLNWTNAGLSVTNYTEADFVTFDDKAVTGNVTLLGNQHSPSGVTVNNNTVNYVLSGSGKISGATSLAKSGSASLRLSQSGGDNFSGGIFVHGGTLVLDDANSALAGGLTNDSGTIVQLGNNDANGNMPLGTVQINGSLVFNLTNSRTISTAITGSGTVTQSGSNTLTLTGANTYTGNTTVIQGTLALSGAVTINSSPLIAVQNSTLDVSRAESGSLTAVTLTNGNLNVGLGTNSTTMNSLSLSNSTVTLIADYNNIGGSPIMGAGNLSTGGTTNMLNVTAIRNLPITASLPFDIPLMSYSSATFNSGFNLGWTNLTGISGYISNNTIASTIDLIITNAPQTLTWNGGSLTDNNWNDPANWSGSTLQPLDAMTFDGLLRTNNINNTPAGTTYAGITFNNSQGPAPFTLGGAPINLVGTMINNASIVQTVNLGQLVSANYTNDGGGSGGSLTINGGFTNISGSTETVTLLNTGTLVDLWATNNGAQGGGQLEFQLGAGGGDWVIMDGTGTNGLVQAGNVQLNMAGGTLEFGSSNSSPNVDAGFTNAASAVTVNGAPGTFNMNSGTLKVYGMNMANSGTANANFNMNGGTLIIGSNSFSGGGGNGGSVLTAVITNGAIYSTNGGAFTLAQRSPSTLTMGGGLLRIGALSLSSGTAATGTGTVNLNGGTFNCTNVSVGSSAANGWGTIFYNGGTFQIGASVSALFKQNNLVPLTNAVQAGGAVIDSGGTSSTFNWPLISDPALGGAPDGGLVKIGAGTVTLSAGNSYIGNTTISAGTLAVSGSLSNGTVTVAAAGTLAGSGTVGGSVIVNGTIAPGSTNTIGTLTVTTNVSLSGTTLMKLNAATVTSDNLAAPGAGQGSIALGGALVVSNISASPLAAGQTFTLFTTPSLSGSFTSIQPATPGAGLAWNTNNLGVNGTLSVVSSGGGPTTNATITHVSLSGTNLLVHGTNNNVPNTSFRYVVLSATNVATPLSNWVPVVTNSFNPDGTFDYTNPVVPGTPRQFIDVKAVP